MQDVKRPGLDMSGKDFLDKMVVLEGREAEEFMEMIGILDKWDKDMFGNYYGYILTIPDAVVYDIVGIFVERYITRDFKKISEIMDRLYECSESGKCGEVVEEIIRKHYRGRDEEEIRELLWDMVRLIDIMRGIPGLAGRVIGEIRKFLRRHGIIVRDVLSNCDYGAEFCEDIILELEIDRDKTKIYRMVLDFAWRYENGKIIAEDFVLRPYLSETLDTEYSISDEDIERMKEDLKNLDCENR